jgi:hypothetical protein
LTEFVLFPKLPIELRLKIWKYALPTHPRTIEIHQHVLPAADRNSLNDMPRWYPRSTENSPQALYYVSREARAEVLRVHGLEVIRGNLDGRPVEFCDFSRDSFVFPQPFFFGRANFDKFFYYTFPPEIRNAIKRIETPFDGMLFLFLSNPMLMELELKEIKFQYNSNYFPSA